MTRKQIIPGLLLLGILAAYWLTMKDKRAEFWIDLTMGEPVDTEAVFEDLRQVDVVFIGETHRLERHHRLQREILVGLAAAGRPIILGLEQVEARYQPELDRFNGGESSFEQLAAAIEWEKQWSNYEDYRGLLAVAREHAVRVVGLNAPRDVIREVGRRGIAALESTARQQLPQTILLEDPLYEQLMDKLLSVHMQMDPASLRNVFEAQAARDDSMAANLVAALQALAGNPAGTPMALVVCGSGHVQFGLGTPDRVRNRLPDGQHRIVLMSESGDLILTPEEEAMRRDIELKHADLKFINRPLADYLYAKDALPEEDEEE